jgi:hypothetical protein
MPRYTRALLIGVDQYGTAGCVADVARWRALLLSLGADVTTLLGEVATAQAVKDAARALSAGVTADREASADAAGVLVFAGVGWSDGVRSGVCLAGGERLPYDDLVVELDEGAPALRDARDAAAPPDSPVLTRLPRPGLLAVLDTASASLPPPPGSVSRAHPAAPAAPSTGEVGQPRLCYHARQIAPQGRCGSWEQDGQGDVTRWFLPWFAAHHAELELFGQEIGPGTNGIVRYALRDQAGASLGMSVWTAAAPAPVAGVTPPAERTRWYLDTFPDVWSMVPLTARQRRLPARPPLLDTPHPAFPPPRQGGALPPASVVYALTGDGLPLGYMGLQGPRDAPTGQWWAAPFGVVDNHGFYVHSGTVELRAVAAPPAVPGSWRIVGG